jgi:hypothetical protein
MSLESVLMARNAAQTALELPHRGCHLIDGPIEESVELFAAASILAVALAYVADLRNERISSA